MSTKAGQLQKGQFTDDLEEIRRLLAQERRKGRHGEARRRRAIGGVATPPFLMSPARVFVWRNFLIFHLFLSWHAYMQNAHNLKACNFLVFNFEIIIPGR